MRPSLGVLAALVPNAQAPRPRPSGFAIPSSISWPARGALEGRLPASGRLTMPSSRGCADNITFGFAKSGEREMRRAGRNTDN